MAQILYSDSRMNPFMKSEAGFSLSEVIMAMAITGILSGLASVSFLSQLPHHRLNIAARDLVSDLRSARRLALTERQAISVILDMDGNRYWIEKSQEPDVPVGWVHELQGRSRTFGGVYLMDSTGGPEITFQSNGITTDWTTITLENNSGDQRKITVILTGRVKIL